MNQSRTGSKLKSLAAFTLIFLVISILTTACTATKKELIVASTTSIEDSGLFDELMPAFKKAYPSYNPKVVAVGSGEALELGRRGDADVLLVHSPADEEEFMRQKHGIKRSRVMHNYFVIVGPKSDPAGVVNVIDTVEAVSRVAISGSPFISRGDKSGTHKKEQSLWKAAGITPKGDWYISAGQGMSEVLTITSERQGYTLSDRATFLAGAKNLDLAVLVENSEQLLNLYSVIVPTRSANREGAEDFATWLTSSEGRTVIGLFGKKKYGQSLFTPGWPTGKREATGSATGDSGANGLDDGAHSPGGGKPDKRHDLPDGN